jgi:hypothetical protein
MEGTASRKSKPQNRISKKSSSKSKLISAKSKKEPAKAKQNKQWPFPVVTLEEAIKIAQMIHDEYAGRPMPARFLYVITRSSSSSLKNLLRAANQYGIVAGSSINAYISLTELGRDIVAPVSPDQRQSALLKAFLNVELFRNLAEFYAGQPLPEVEFLKNNLERQFGIRRQQIPKFIDVFMSNLEYLKAFAVDDIGQTVIPTFVSYQATSDDRQASSTTISTETEGVREFLDTCFILMPFGDWFDKYFKEIYVPATKDAGFEPLRADGLFKAGAVMEQIWTQIQKAKVLLADLTDKNPNVFYELGLAHALRKPVVFVAGDIEDVPFDVRHLRVVIYDVREPRWAERLQSDISAYLKNTRTDPDKSIPQPFRENLPGHLGFL